MNEVQPLDLILQDVIVPLLALLGGVLSIAFLAALLWLIHFLLTLPMRRAERARLFLELIETALERGLPVEETLISASLSGDRILGTRFHRFAAWLQNGRRLPDAIAAVPHWLPPQLTAMLRVGQQIGDLRKVLPACRQLLQDSLSATRSAVNYLVVLAFVITPATTAVFSVFCVKILPAFRQVADGIGVAQPFSQPGVWPFLRLMLAA